MASIATFAAGVIFSVILKSTSTGPAPPALIYLSYTNSLLLPCIIGCAIIRISIEIFKKKKKFAENPKLASKILTLETVIVGALLVIALYLALYSTALFLDVWRPFMVGSVLYLLIGIIIIGLLIFDIVGKDEKDESKPDTNDDEKGKRSLP